MGTKLVHNDYHTVVEGYGGKGLLISKKTEVKTVLKEAKALAKKGKPVLINVMLGVTDFRKGSISM